MCDIKCPYCGSEEEINHDDGYGHEEDRVHSQECGECEKTFVFTTSVHYSYEVTKADCLNGAPHQWHMTHTYPKEFRMWRCFYCAEEKKPTLEELANDFIMNELKNCPFCGKSNSERDGIMGIDHHPECYIILMETELPNSPIRAMAWNTRHADTELVDALKQIKSALDVDDCNSERGYDIQGAMDYAYAKAKNALKNHEQRSE